MASRNCIIEVVCAVCIAAMTSAVVTASFHNAGSMTLEEAMRLAGQHLTPEQRQLVAIAAHEQTVSGVRLLLTLAEAPGLAGDEARAALDRLRMLLR